MDLGWEFDCGEGNPIYYGSYGTESLKWWGANDAIPLVDPWIKGQYRRNGVDYFSSGPNMTGAVISGPFGFTSHLYDPDFSGDLPKWTETVTGKFWGINVPGGAVGHQPRGQSCARIRFRIRIAFHCGRA